MVTCFGLRGSIAALERKKERLQKQIDKKIKAKEDKLNKRGCN